MYAPFYSVFINWNDTNMSENNRNVSLILT